MVAIVTLLQHIKLRNEHINGLKKTPFWALFDAILKNKINCKQCSKYDDISLKIIQTYQLGSSGSSQLGPEIVKLTTEDIKSIFGISCGDEPIHLGYENKRRSSFLTRRYIQTERLSSTTIIDLLQKALKGKKKEDTEDVMRMLCMYTCLKLFFSTSGTTVGWVFLNYIEDINSMRKYNWAEAIRNTLMSSIEKYHKNPAKVTGCVMALLVTSAQLNEEIQEQEQQKQDTEKTEEEEEEDGQYAEECHQEQKPANEDFNDFCNIILNDAPEGEEQIHQQTLEKLQIENNNFQLDNIVKPIYINKLEEDNRLLTAQIQQLKDKNSRLHNQLVEKEVHEITQEICAVKHSGTDAKNEGHTINDENSQVLQKEVHENSEVVDKELHQKEVHENSEVVDKELHQKEVHEITQQPFATKHCETNTNVKDCQNSQLQNQLLEEEVHDLTQQVCAIKADDLTESRQTNLQNSMIKNIKAKARKTTEVSDYEYRGKKVKVEKEKEHKDETISNKYAMAQLLPPEDKYKLQILWKEKQTESSACIWFGTRYENCVFFNDIKNLVKGTDISSCTIDAYAEILQREPQAQNSSDGAEHNGKSFILSSLYWQKIIHQYMRDTPCQAEKAWNPDVKIESVKDSP
ncbi:uncharacterized protein LOC114279839 [Camellia sinensis]|uniref:uncharacterized protein LOC114279839 n=1 Tax=Camellia sinensis TaxID=4442 RepID=UPI0010363F3D|nr:uncharacterized protein LOC114279839 [Camellia sinensis]